MSFLRQPAPHSQPRTRSVPASSAPKLQGEEGFILLWVIFLAVMLLIALAVAAPRVAISIQRQKEIELVHRGQQYQRAIQLYYRKFGTYPASIDQLLNTDNMRFLRKRYKDPMTGKDDWRIIHLGQAKVPPMGFFGKPLTGLNGATGIGTPIGGAAGAPVSGIPGVGSSTTGSSPFGSSGINSPGEAGGFSNDNASPNGTPGAPTSEESAPATPDSAGFSSNSGKDAAGFSTAKDDSNSIGGGPIVGVGVPDPKASLISYKKQAHYNLWEFVYNPIEDQMKAAGQQGIATQSGTSNSNDNGFGNLGGNGSGTNTPGSGSGLGSFGSGSDNSGSTNFGGSGSGSTGSGNPPSNPNQSQDPQQ
jgi:type II secretory pathway pseudopilin PulG